VAEFVPGLELARAFYCDVVVGIVGPVPHAATALGEGSDILGFDTERSTDHSWGPRAHIFVAADKVDNVRARLDARLPDTFRGWPVRFYRWQTDKVEHHVEVTTLHDWLDRHLGLDPRPSPDAAAWLALPQQLLLEVTGGAVFRDDMGELTRVRELLRWYPDDVWLWMMAAQWHRLAENESFVGRTAELGDDLGSRLVAARIARDAVRLCFLQERRYAPYAKWLGTAFGRLAAATEMGPLIHDTFVAADFDHRERALLALYEALARRHNTLGITAPQATTPGHFEVGVNDAVRPFLVLNAGRFAQACLESLADGALRRYPLVGSIDQLTEPTDALIHFTDWPRQLGAIYRRRLELEPGLPDYHPVTEQASGGLDAPIGSHSQEAPGADKGANGPKQQP